MFFRLLWREVDNRQHGTTFNEWDFAFLEFIWLSHFARPFRCYSTKYELLHPYVSTFAGPLSYPLSPTAALLVLILKKIRLVQTLIIGQTLFQSWWFFRIISSSESTFVRLHSSTLPCTVRIKIYMNLRVNNEFAGEKIKVYLPSIGYNRLIFLSVEPEKKNESMCLCHRTSYTSYTRL